MKRWMTALALAGKWGAAGVLGPRAAEASGAMPSVSREASAILPMPIPQSWKKWRRVRALE